MRFHLRQHTAEAHARLDAAVGAFDTLEDYGRYLRSLLNFRAPVEAALEGIPLPGGFHSRGIADAIRADMHDLGIDTDEGAGQPILLPQLDNASSQLGALYVLEGSSLGARLLYKRAQALGLSETFGARHLAIQSGDRDSWPRFLALLEKHPQEAADAAARASIATFELALRAFCIPGETVR